MSLFKYQVGEVFPHPLPAGEGLVLQTLPNGTFDAIAKLGKPSSKERTAWKQGMFRYGLFVSEDVPYFVMQFRDSGLELAAPYNFLKVHADQRLGWTEGEANAVTLHLVNESNILLAMRMIGMEPEMMNLFRQTVQKQLERYETWTDVEHAINSVSARYSTSEMLKSAKLYTVIR